MFRLIKEIFIRFVTSIVNPSNHTKKTVLTKSTSRNFYIIFTFLLMTIASLIAVTIYCYLIKYK